MKTETKNNLGDIIDKIDNYKCSLNLPLPNAMHMEMMKTLLQEISDSLKKAYEAETGENPWID